MAHSKRSDGEACHAASAGREVSLINFEQHYLAIYRDQLRGILNGSRDDAGRDLEAPDRTQFQDPEIEAAASGLSR